MASIYRFKYERDGKVYASKDMLPSEDDVLLIDRDVLEGRKEAAKPAPQPTPEPAPEPIDNAASMEALKLTLESIALNDESSIEIDETFKFKNCSFFDLNYNVWSCLDTEATKHIIGCLDDGSLSLDFDVSMKLSAYAKPREYGDPIELEFFGAGDLSDRTGTATIHRTSAGGFGLNVNIETDAETGDSWIVSAMPVTERVPGELEAARFDGEIRVRYNK